MRKLEVCRLDEVSREDMQAVIPATAKPTVRIRRLTPFEQRRSRPDSVTRPEGLPVYSQAKDLRRAKQLQALFLRLLERSWTLNRVMGCPSAVPAHVREKYLCRLDKVISKVKRRVRR